MSVRIPVVAVSREHGGIVSEGDVIRSRKGEHAIFVQVSRAAIPGKSGKIIVRLYDDNRQAYTREYYDSVFNLDVSGMLPCGCVLSMSSDCVHVEIGNAASGILPETAG